MFRPSLSPEVQSRRFQLAAVCEREHATHRANLYPAAVYTQAEIYENDAGRERQRTCLFLFFLFSRIVHDKVRSVN